MKNNKRKTVVDILAMKRKKPVVCLTAYTAPMAAILDEYVDILLVGDSVGMVLYGMPNTLAVSVEMIKQHGKAVVNTSNNACVVVDMPFGSYQGTKEQAFINAAEIISFSGCNALKLEGGKEIAETVAYLVDRGIPVVGHVGLQPQSFNITGGYGIRGKSRDERKKILDGAVAIEKAGAFAIVLENIVPDLGEEITRKISIPTIGIGASPKCDGQVLVTEDMLGLFGKNVPKFVTVHGNLRENIKEAVEKYCTNVRKS